MSFELRFTLPNQQAQVVPIIEPRSLIGTLMSNEVVLRAAGVEPIHAMIETLDGGQVVITDLGSKSGVRVNGATIEVEIPLKAGDQIVIGEIIIEVALISMADDKVPAFKNTDNSGARSFNKPDSARTYVPSSAPSSVSSEKPVSVAKKLAMKMDPRNSERRQDSNALFSPRKARPSGNVLEVVSYWGDTILDVELFHPSFKGFEQVSIGDPTKAHFLAGGKTEFFSHVFMRVTNDGFQIRMLPDMQGRMRRGGKVEEFKGECKIDMGRRDIAHISQDSVRYFAMFVQPPALDLPAPKPRDPFFAILLALAMMLYFTIVPLLWMADPKPKDVEDDDAWTTVNVPLKLEKPKFEVKAPEPPPPPPPPKPEQKVAEKKEPPPPKPPVPKPLPPKPAEPVVKEKPVQEKVVEKPAEVPAEKPSSNQELKNKLAQMALPALPVPPVPKPKPLVDPRPAQKSLTKLPDKASPTLGMASANNIMKADIKKPGPKTTSTNPKTGGAVGSGNERRGGERKGMKALSTAGAEGPKNDKPSGINLSKLGLGAGRVLDKTGPGAIATTMKSSAGGAGGGSGSAAKTRGLGGIGGAGSLGLAGAAGAANNFGSGSGGPGSGEGGLGGLGGNGIGAGFGSRGGGGNGKGRANVEVPPGDPLVSGGLTSQEVQAVIRANLNQIRHCYEQLLQRSPSASGKIKVEFTVAPNGRVTAASIVSSTVSDGVMKGCVSGAVYRWAFPKPRGGEPVSVTYPFVFNPV